jgi:hypothetical protein
VLVGFIVAALLLRCRADALLLDVLCALMMRQQQIAKLLAKHTMALYAVFAILLLGVAVFGHQI